MRRCVACGSQLGESWACAACGFEPAWRDGVLVFSGRTAAGNGFDPAAYAQLAELESESFWFRSRNKLILWALNRYWPHAQSLLEVGCGTGFVLAAIRDEHPQMRLAGADLFAEGLAHARRRVADASWYQLDVVRSPFDGEWDVVTAFDVLEHVPDDEAVLRGLHKAVRPGGGLLVTVPQHRWLWSASDDYGKHVRRYARAELVDRVTRAGFSIRRVTSFVTLLLPAMWASRLVDRRSHGEFDPSREHVRTRLSGAFERTLDLERRAIGRGVDLPAGGSLLLVATRT